VVSAPERFQRLDLLRTAILGYLEETRLRDPSLASLRGSEEFEALFRD